MNESVVYLMRGLPSCGKSFTARQLAGPQGVICETDEYFYTQVGEDPQRFDWRDELLTDAREWNFARFQSAVRNQATPIIVDRGNGLNAETRRYAQFASEHAYRVELAEPNSPWWQEIRPLLVHPTRHGRQLDMWAEKLAGMSRSTHRVPAKTIRRWMQSWKHDLTVHDILQWTGR